MLRSTTKHHFFCAHLALQTESSLFPVLKHHMEQEQPSSVCERSTDKLPVPCCFQKWAASVACGARQCICRYPKKHWRRLIALRSGFAISIYNNGGMKTAQQMPQNEILLFCRTQNNARMAGSADNAATCFVGLSFSFGLGQLPCCQLCLALRR